MLVSKRQLKNGLRLLLAPNSSALSATILVLVAAGSKYETKKVNGISHFLEHMCFKGTTRRPKAIDISRELDALGASYNAFTAQEYTGYYVSCLPDKLDPAFDIIADMYANPLLESAEIEKEKGVILEEINMYEDMPQRKVQDLLLELMYGDQPAGWNIAGTKETVRKITRENFLRYRRTHYLAKATLVVVSGRFDPRSTEKLAARHLAGLDGGKKHGKKPVKEAQRSPRLKLKTKKSDQAHLALAFRTFGLDHKDFYAANILADILGGSMSSRLFQKVRAEMGAAYYIRAEHDAFTDHGLLDISAGVDTGRTTETLQAILGECRRLKQELVPERELEIAKDSMIGNLYLSLETSAALASYLGVQEILQHKVLAPREVATKMRAVTAADIRQLAQSVLLDQSLNLALISPHQDSAKFVKVLHL